MGKSPDVGGELIEFKEVHILDRVEVNKYRKLGKYSKFGVYFTGVLIYAVMALYFSPDTSITDWSFIGVVVIATTSLVLTLLFWMNRRSYDFNDLDHVNHEVAVLIEEVDEASSEQDFSDDISQFQDRVLDNDNGIVSKVWRAELESYFEYIEEHEGEDIDDNFNEIFTPFVRTLNALSDLDLESDYGKEEEESSQAKREPGFFTIVIDSVTSDVITKEMLIWGDLFCSGQWSPALGFRTRSRMGSPSRYDCLWRHKTLRSATRLEDSKKDLQGYDRVQFVQQGHPWLLLVCFEQALNCSSFLDSLIHQRVRADGGLGSGTLLAGQGSLLPIGFPSIEPHRSPVSAPLESRRPLLFFSV